MGIGVSGFFGCSDQRRLAGHLESWVLQRDLLRGSWDLVTGVIIKVTILIITYNPS